MKFDFLSFAAEQLTKLPEPIQAFRDVLLDPAFDSGRRTWPLHRIPTTYSTERKIAEDSR